MGYAYDADLISRIKPRISQWEATTGRRISPSMLDALIKGQLEAESGKAIQTRALDLQEQGQADSREATKKANKAAAVSGMVGAATTAGTLGLTYHALTKPSPMSEFIKYQQAKDAAALASKSGAPALATTGAPATGGIDAGTAASTAAYDPFAASGAQTALAGGAAPVGAQTVPAVAGASAPEAAAITGQGAWAEPAAGGGTSLMSYALPVAAGYGAHALGGKVSDILGTHEKTTRDVMSTLGSGGMAAYLFGGPVGLAVGGATAVINTYGSKIEDTLRDIGSDIGDIFGW